MKFLPSKPPTAVVILLILILAQVSFRINAQVAPITTVATITNATTGTGATIVPIKVSNFVSIGAFTLTLRYRLAYATYVSATPNTAFPGMTITHSTSGLYGKIVINWPQTPGGITLPDESVLLSLNFTYITGNCALVWLFSGFGNVCQYKKYSSGSYIILNDSPKQSYYLNGGFSSRGAPSTYAPVINTPSPGPLAVPVTVNNFSDIGNFNLSIEFDGDVLSFVNCVKNPLLTAQLYAGLQTGSNGNMILNISYTDPYTISLPNGSTLFTINYNYSTTSGSCSGLNFINDGSNCEYANGFAEPYFDIPTSSYYYNGLVYTQYSPKIWLPVIKNAFPAQAVSLPAFVKDFNNVRSFSLAFEYDPGVMTYTGFTPDVAFGSGLAVSDILSGSKRKVVLSWNGTASKTLPDGSCIADIHFNYISGTSTLAWIVTDETSCRFNDAAGNAYYDIPKSTYYQDGLLASHVAPLTVGGQQSAVSGQNTVVPVKVHDFTTIGSFALTLDYDPSVLTYQGAALVPAIGGTFSAATAGLGRIMMDWSGPAASLANNNTLVNLTFTYNGGATTLAWYDYGDSCRYSETIAGNALYDLPQSGYYINGYVGPDPVTANFTANNTSGDLNTTITLTDQSTGSPTGWNWSLSPSTYYFVNGTSASSQNPQVKFTSNGGYTVTLIVTKGTAGATEIKTDYLHIGTPGLWKGITSTDWNTGSNWHNYAVPASTVNVLIPSSAPNWPAINGNLNIGGAQCLNLTVQGPAQLTVNGNLSISGGSELSFTGSGSLFLSGNWTNNGTFNCGTSTVNFTGTAEAFVNDNGSTQNFYRIIVTKSPGKVNFLGAVNVLGED